MNRKFRMLAPSLKSFATSSRKPPAKLRKNLKPPKFDPHPAIINPLVNAGAFRQALIANDLPIALSLYRPDVLKTLVLNDYLMLLSLIHNMVMNPKTTPIQLSKCKADFYNVCKDIDSKWLYLPQNISYLLINMYSTFGNIDKACKVFENLKVYSSTKNKPIELETYKAILRVYSKNSMIVQTELLFKELLEVEDIALDLETFYLLIEAYSSVNNPIGAFKIFDYLVNETKLVANMGIFHSLLRAASKIKNPAPGQSPVELFQLMKEFVGQPNEVTYSLIFSILTKNGQYEEALKLFSDMVENLSEYGNIRSSLIMYNSLINIYANAGNLEKTLSMRNKMGEYNLTPDAVTHNIVLGAFRKKNDLNGALKYIEQMQRNGHVATTMHYNTILAFYGDDSEAMYKAYNSFISPGLLPDIYSFKRLIFAFGKVSDLDKVDSLFDEMENTYNITPSSSLYGIAIANCTNVSHRINWAMEKEIPPSISALPSSHQILKYAEKYYAILLQKYKMVPVITKNRLLNLSIWEKLIEGKSSLSSRLHHGIQSYEKYFKQSNTAPDSQTLSSNLLPFPRSVVKSSNILSLETVGTSGMDLAELKRCRELELKFLLMVYADLAKHNVELTPALHKSVAERVDVLNSPIIEENKVVENTEMKSETKLEDTEDRKKIEINY